MSQEMAIQMGAQIVVAVGSALIQRAMQKDTVLPDAIGNRMQDLMVQNSEYGKTIPIIYGHNRFAGNVIWARDIQEVERRETSSVGGGKGGGGGSTSQTGVSYEYFATLAIAICEGEIDNITKVWADAGALTSEKLQLAEGKYEIFYGTESQTASSIIESYEGAGNVPAYRGIAYVVIEDFPLALYGNRIPNFTFEVERKVTLGETSTEQKVKAISIIPGSGEFVYSSTVTEKYTIQLIDGLPLQTGKRIKVNMHNFDNVANALLALDQLEETFPNLEAVSIIVNWFITSSDVGSASIVPKVEFDNTEGRVEPTEWSVAGLSRSTAQIVEQFPDGSLTYGGTPTDKSIVTLCQAAKAKGWFVMLYPMPVVDTVDETPGETDKPWRGRLVPASSAEVTAFFGGTWGYNNFIQHYSQLTVDGTAIKDVIDAFIIGSELVGLTTYDSGSNTYPAVTALAALAADVKTDFTGTAVVIGYAADWSEYHSIGGYYHLDELWIDSNIDFVGIDGYFPITPDVDQIDTTKALITQYWEDGEGWDYYYTDPVARTGLTSYSGDPTFAWKNVENWWNTDHYHNADDPGSPTGWTAKMKPIWFTEFGFPSVDGAANQPNVFVDVTSSESAYPRKSKRRVDFRAQREAIDATLDYLDDRNGETGNDDLVPTNRAFLWTWDARPFPFFPDLTDVWGDGINWKTGHWVNGKIGVSTLAAIVSDIMVRVGFDESDFDVSELTDLVEGYMIGDRQTARDAIDTLQAAYFFDALESNGQIKFVRRGKASIVTIPENNLVPLSLDPIRVNIEILRKHELELPRRIDVSYINRVADYGSGTQTSQRWVAYAEDQVSLNIPIVMSDTEAKQIADKTLYTTWVARHEYTLQLSTKYAYLEPADVITVTVNNVDYIMRIQGIQMQQHGLMQIKAVAEDVSTYDFYIEPGTVPNVQEPGNDIPDTRLILMDTPAFPTDTDDVGVLRVAMSSLGTGWLGVTLYRSDDGGVDEGNTFIPILSTNSQAIIGQAMNELGAASPDLFDNGNYIDVALLGGELSSVTELAMLNGANFCMVGDELIQFQYATFIEDNVYRLTKLLRGRLGTEHEISNHAVGDNFVFFDSAVKKYSMPISFFSITKHYKPVTVGQLLTNVDETEFSYTGKKLKPYAPVQIEGSRDVSDNLTITWVRRTRLNGDWRDGVDVPLAETIESYEIDILDGVTVVRTLTSTEQTVEYSAANQTTDFGSPQSSVSVKIYQISEIVGRGYAGIATI